MLRSLVRCMGVRGQDSPTWARPLRKIVITAAGSVVLLVGMAMIVLPGPALLVIPAGLAILGTEFAWARRALTGFKDRARALWPRRSRDDVR